jgi:hypothetical protein
MLIFEYIGPGIVKSMGLQVDRFTENRFAIEVFGDARHFKRIPF